MKLGWLDKAVKTMVELNTPYGYIINPKAVEPIARRLAITKGICPCTHEEWDENTKEEDKLCPCITFRETGNCHCGLYLKVKMYDLDKK